MISWPEIIFAVLTSMVVFGVILLLRSGSNRTEGTRLERDDSDDSGVITLSKDPITLIRKPEPTGAGARVDRWFDRAVLRSGLDASPAGVVAVSSLLALILAAGLYFWKQQLGLTLVGVLIGVSIPVVVVAILQGRYKRRIQDQLPDALYLLAGSLRSGLTMEQALEFFSQRGNKPLADEFKHTVGLMRLGSSVTAALKATADRIGLLDFDLLVSTVGLHAQTGGNLALLLDRLAASVRDRNQFRGQFRATTAQARIVAIAIGAAVPLFLIAYVLFEPEHVAAFFASTTGWAILIGCVVMELIGVFWLWRVFRIEY